ncbi:MAG: MBOAT family O-acyltransferase [Desulfovibrio sp.]|jgi:D-alanyl-lipoteichoic acid acyltransferase DltB (MBOAT superfamily)|nr:MBOAT family protein [Mailhella sp.]
MNFVTQSFVIFFLFALPLCLATSGKRQFYIPALILCNLVFYFSTGIKGICVLFLAALIAWSGGRLLTQRKSRMILILCVSALLSLLGLFKYYEFFLFTFSDLSALAGLQVSLLGALGYSDFFVYITGLSFFSFQAISYIADCYTDKIEVPFSFPEILAYLSFFPTVCAGPIMRAGVFFEQAGNLRIDDDSFSEAACLILSGLIKKVIIASYLSEHIVREVFATPDACSSAAILLGIYGYAAQIYCDFSGYSDLAMGIGRLMGFNLPQNFKDPYLALSIQDFWRRWHITLSSWLRDYVYIPLGGSRRGNTYVNLMLTMILGGLWHGSAWTFVLWGGLHGAGLVAHRVLSKFFKEISHGFLWRALSWMLTFHVVAALWVLFRADDISIVLAIFKQLFAFSNAGSGCPLLAVASVAACFFIQCYGHACSSLFLRMIKPMHWLLQALVAGLLGMIIMALGPEGTLPFIYFGF